MTKYSRIPIPLIRPTYNERVEDLGARTLRRVLQALNEETPYVDGLLQNLIQDAEEVGLIKPVNK